MQYCTLFSISHVALKLKLEIEVQLHCSLCNFKGPAVWLLWCEWQLEGPPSPGDPPEPYYARVRSAFEDALAACGLHVTLGSNLWAAYRDFETQLLHSLEVCTVVCRVMSDDCSLGSPVSYCLFSLSSLSKYSRH